MLRRLWRQPSLLAANPPRRRRRRRLLQVFNTQNLLCHKLCQILAMARLQQLRRLRLRRLRLLLLLRIRSVGLEAGETAWRIRIRIEQRSEQSGRIKAD
jgi:hypothetical protein